MHYYNEFDPKTAAWLRQLIADKLIPAGYVDERSIELVQPDDLKGFKQWHFFAGVAGWVLALRYAGWPEDRPIWTGSCPCPPFSCAGKKKNCPQCQSADLIPHPYRTGIFVCCTCQHEWFADGRHLWPEFHRLIEHCRPERIAGEQVASADGRIWLAGVRASLEILGYGVGCSDLCISGIGGPNIRQRLFWMAYAKRDGESGWTSNQPREGTATAPAGTHDESGRRSNVSRLADSEQPGLEGHSRDGSDGSEPRRIGADPVGPATQGSCTGGPADGLADSDERGQRERDTEAGPRETALQLEQSIEAGRMGNPESDNEQRNSMPGAHGERQQTGGSSRSERLADAGSEQVDSADAGGLQQKPSGHIAWSDYTVIHMQDGKSRRTQRGTFPLALGISKGVVPVGDPSDEELQNTGEARVTRLRGYGNAISPFVAAEFIMATEEAIKDLAL